MKKRFLSIILAIYMAVLLMPVMPAIAYAEEGETDNSPSVSAFATKDQLMNSFKSNGDIDGKVVFGKNSGGTAQEWFIMGKDTKVSGDNTMIFAASSIKNNQFFREKIENPIPYNPQWGCDYGDNSVNQVATNHYGSSDLRAALKAMAADTSYFTSAEQSMMNTTTVSTYDPHAGPGITYTTSDKLYPLSNEFWWNTIMIGTKDTTYAVADKYAYNGNGTYWTRAATSVEEQKDLYVWVIDCAEKSFHRYWAVNSATDVRPAGNLNLSNVLFASAAEASSNGVATGTIESDKAMTLRMDGTDKYVGAVSYDANSGVIKAYKPFSLDNTTVSLVVQGNDGTRDWYYSMPVSVGYEALSTIVSKEQIASACGVSDLSLADCKIWLEKTDSDARMTYAVMAEEKEIPAYRIDDITLLGMTPTPENAFPGKPDCRTSWVESSNITYTTNVDGGEVEVTGTADWNTTYKATVTMQAISVYNNDPRVFASNVSVKIDGEALPEHLSPNADGTLTITKEFTTEKKKSITGVNSPSVPTGNTFTNYYGYDGYEALPVNGRELGTQATVAVLDKQDNTTQNKTMNVTWTIANDGGTGYDKTPGATNTFRWTIPASALADYDVTRCPGYDSSTGTITGTVSITNKAATPVTITGTDSAVDYSGTDIDASRYFTIDRNAGTATYSLLAGTEGGTGEGTLSGSKLSVTKTGTFRIKVNTAANGIYAAGEKTITLTVGNGTIRYTASDYSGVYDGQPHSIGVNVSAPSGATVTYSTDETTYGIDNPSYVDEGTYTVHYRIQKNNYDTVEGSKTVIITKKPVTITADAQKFMWGNNIDQGAYSVSENGIAAGDSIAEITLTPSTTELTDEGTISINDVKIENTAKRDVTGNYDLTLVNGTLEITHNTSLAPESIDAVKTKTSYIAGETLNVDDITVTVYYADGYSEEVSDYTINVDDIDMSTAEYKTLTVTYTKNGGTETDDIIITVSPEIIEGMGMSVTAGEKKTLSFTSNAEFDDFIRVELDGKTLDKKNYTTKKGSTIVTLKADYVATLSVGEHTIGIVSKTGTATATFTVAKAQKPTESNPNDPRGSNSNTGSLNRVSQTGDNSHMALWAAILFASVGMLTLMVIYYKKKKNNR